MPKYSHFWEDTLCRTRGEKESHLCGATQGYLTLDWLRLSVSLTIPIQQSCAPLKGFSQGARAKISQRLCDLWVAKCMENIQGSVIERYVIRRNYFLALGKRSKAADEALGATRSIAEAFLDRPFIELLWKFAQNRTIDNKGCTDTFIVRMCAHTISRHFSWKCANSVWSMSMSLSLSFIALRVNNSANRRH